MMRILNSSDEATATVRLEGKLRQAWVPEVRAAVARAQAGGPATLDLQGVTYVDRQGLELLGELTASGVALVGASPFVRELLADFLRRSR